MGRTKQYDRTALLDAAIELFRMHGYTATTTARLAAELQVNPKTMYAEFGSKQGLFDATLQRYSQTHLSRVLAPIEAPGAGADAIRQAFDGFGRAGSGWARGRGCLMCNTAVERAALDPGARRHVDAYLTRVTGAFRAALVNARADGDLSADADVDGLASFFTMSLIGVSASIRAEAPAAQIQAACRVTTSVLG